MERECWKVVFCVLITFRAITADEALQVMSTAVAVHSGPGPTFSKIGHILPNQKYVSIASNDGWKKIWYGKTTGWIQASSTIPTSGAFKKVIAQSGLRARMGPSTNYTLIGTAPLGSKWAILGTSGSWSQLNFAGKTAWMYSGYLAAPTPSANSLGLPVSSVGFVQLPGSGPGYYSYMASYRQWGTSELVYGLLTAAKSWKMKHPIGVPRIGIGDLSLKNGGYFGRHASHKTGKDVDIRPVRKDMIEAPTRVGSSSYSKDRTYYWITNYLKKYLKVRVIFFNDSKIYNPLSYVQYWPNHANHLHLRVW